MSNEIPLLRALRMNAVFSFVSAVMLVVTGRWIAEQLGLGSVLPVYITAGLLTLFALQLWNIVRTREIKMAEILGIIAVDLAWVVATIVLAAMFYESMSMVGLVLVDVIAVIVLVLAILQIRGLRALRTNPVV